MSDAIDYIALQKSKAIQYMIAQILDESRIKNLLPADTVELAIMRGMEYQKKLDEINNPEPKEDKEWMYFQRNYYTVSEEDKYYHGYHALKKN